MKTGVCSAVNVILGMRGWRSTRRGFSLLEFDVAMVLLGLTLAGLFPLAAMHSRVLRSLEERFAVTGRWYFAPSTDVWARKLGAAATLVREDPGPLPEGPTDVDNEVEIVAFERSLDSEEVVVRVSVTTVSDETSLVGR